MLESNLSAEVGDDEGAEAFCFCPFLPLLIPLKRQTPGGWGLAPMSNRVDPRYSFSLQLGLRSMGLFPRVFQSVTGNV